MTVSLLFEIGAEEIPAGYLAAAKTSILNQAPSLLEECGFQFDQLNVETTPRRIVIGAENFRAISVREEEKLGPLKEQAYRDGKASPALSGFLKNVGREESDVFFKETPRGERVCVKIKREKKPLRYFFETLPQKIEFPKLMRWEPSRYRFTRPIRWTFAFVGKQVQKYRIGDVNSGNVSYGHRFFSPNRFRITSSDLELFEKKLKEHHVVLKTEERIARIRNFLKHSHAADENLIQTVAHLVEEPFLIRGSFDKKYLKLPETILVTCMSKHQKIFARRNASGKLVNQFVAVINGPRKNQKLIAGDYESVLNSRLEDAEFFFQEDRKTKLESKVKGLQEMIFLGSLGSYLDKTKRVEGLVRFLGSELRQPKEVIEGAARAAHLAKADLMTHLVYEFPELQGAAGSEYARLEGEKDAVAQAIAGHYLPANLSEDYRHLKKRINTEGALVGICDRIDLLVGAAGLGIEVSGSQDPYALRRASGSVVKILRAYPFHFSLSGLIQKAGQQYGSLVSKPASQMVEELLAFLKERVVFELQVKAGTKEFDLLQAILASRFDEIAMVYEKFNQLAPHLEEASFIRACKVAERTARILKGIQDDAAQINPDLLSEEAEKGLFDLVNREEPVIVQMLEKSDYSGSAKVYGDKFYQPVHDFFDHVLVNHEDEKIRANRQALVRRVNRIYSKQGADLSQLKLTSA